MRDKSLSLLQPKHGMLEGVQTVSRYRQRHCRGTRLDPQRLGPASEPISTGIVERDDLVPDEVAAGRDVSTLLFFFCLDRFCLYLMSM